MNNDRISAALAKLGINPDDKKEVTAADYDPQKINPDQSSSPPAVWEKGIGSDYALEDKDLPVEAKEEKLTVLKLVYENTDKPGTYQYDIFVVEMAMLWYNDGGFKSIEEAKEACDKLFASDFGR